MHTHFPEELSASTSSTEVVRYDFSEDTLHTSGGIMFKAIIFVIAICGIIQLMDNALAHDSASDSRPMQMSSD